MKILTGHLAATLFVVLGTLPAAAALAEAGTAPEAQVTRIIQEFGLREAAEPISDHPRWQPRRVIVTVGDWFSRAVPDYEQRLTRAAGPVELVFNRADSRNISADILAGADAVIGSCSLQNMENADRTLLWLHNYSVGMDRCSGLDGSQVEGRVFTNSKRLSGASIAEHSIAMLMALARNFPVFGAAQSQSQWQRHLAQQVQFGELTGKTLLVVGLGGIGTETAWRAHGLGMRVIATRNSSRQGPAYVEYVGLADELLTLAARADVVINALPLTDKTRGLFNAAFFKAVKPGSIFISVGRGASTVTSSLIAALESGKLYGAGLDVTDPEPLPADSPLWQMDNVIITPHISATGPDSIRRMATISVENLRRYVAGEALLNIVNMQAGY